jgi:hypothetical protein
MSLLNYWPSKDEVNRCIHPVAEAAHEAVLLAVHQPSSLSFRVLPDGAKQTATEDDLYAYFTSDDVSTGVHVVPITGASGVGKSHLVRILEVRLHAAADADRYLIIRIPKTASLREVVRLILAPLPDEKYSEVKAAFSKALAEVRIETAVIDFQAKLEIALENLAKKLKAKLEEGRNPVLTEQMAHASALPKFMRDPEVADHFRATVFPKIVTRALAGQGTEVEAGAAEDFSEKDFLLPDSIDLSKASDAARRYYSQLQRSNGIGMRVAADLLNREIVDEATGQLFHLKESMGGMTLQDVFNDIRRQLLIDGRELVVLVEDFKALTGIQETLLNLLVQEGKVGGKREFATMRSAIAVTDGYLTGQDTIATRAKREWTVESRLESQDEILVRTRQLVASYLNAARLGEENVIRSYAAHGRGEAAHSVINTFADPNHDGEGELAEFGFEGDVPLFPFTPLAIASLARTALKQGDNLVYTPRFVIDHVLRDILLSGRHAYAAGQFPPAALQGEALRAEVAQWLQKQNLSGEQRRRYATVLAIWGDSPQSILDIARIPAGVFKAFGLPVPELDRELPPPPPGGSGEDDTVPVPVPVPVPVAIPPSAEEERFEQALEAWVVRNERLPSDPSNDIRTCLAIAINEQLDWSSERCDKLPIGANRISINSNAHGEGNILNVAVRIAEDISDEHGQLRGELLALVRLYKFNKKTADYAAADDDMARVANLVDRLMPQALQYVRAQNAAHLRSATRALIANSRVLGVSEGARTLLSLPPFLFGRVDLPSPPSDSAPAVFREWRAVQEEARLARPQLIKLVLARCGCFQGGGDMAHAFDVVRVVDQAPVDEVKPEKDHFPPEQWRQVSDNLEIKLKPRASKVQEEALRIRTTLNSELGKTFDKQAVVDAMKLANDTMVRIGVWDGDALGQAATFRKLCEEFRGAAVKEALSTLDEAAKSEEDQNDAKFLSRIARLDINPLIVGQRFVAASRAVIVNANKQAHALEQNNKGIDPEMQATQLAAVFDGVQSALAAIDGEGE